MPRRIEEALDQCLDEILRGESVESCLARFPEYSDQLEPLLRIAHQTITSSSVEPHPELKSETRRNLHLSLREYQRNSQLEDALSHCIDLLLEGHPIERCLELYPAHAQTLRPLLQVCVSLQQAFSVEARAEFRDVALERILSSAARGRRGRFVSWVLSSRWRYRGAVALVAVLLVSVIGAGTIRASSDSMPDDLLYPVKEFTEKVQLTLATSKTKEAELHVKLADRRADELVAMARDGEYKRVEYLAEELSEHLQKVSLLVQEQQKEAAIKMVFDEEAAGSSSGLEFEEVRALLRTLDQDIRANDEMFKEALLTVPADMQSAMKEMLQEAMEDYNKAIQALEFKGSVADRSSSKGRVLVFNRYDF
ncbi:MAG: DUF5667 domain-containing protein [Dehalococcoidia bacterium]